MDPLLTAPLIGLTGALVGVIATVVVTTSTSRTQREDELVMSALSHLVGGSQHRTAGIAALHVLRGAAVKGGRAGRWHRYRSAIDALVYAQLLYLLMHGGNRGQAHEIANMDSMAEWLFDGDAAELRDEQKRVQLQEAMQRYARAPATSESEVDTTRWMQRRIENHWLARLAKIDRH
ncbi:hypothetical protein [Agrococcus sp. DT81.2]|uniref:hypothetical protein n=1 Tax=Agrococcus sp. DT81.2 TaxID=3393414 RepID=UPI003CE557C5